MTTQHLRRHNEERYTTCKHPPASSPVAQEQSTRPPFNIINNSNHPQADQYISRSETMGRFHWVNGSKIHTLNLLVPTISSLRSDMTWSPWSSRVHRRRRCTWKEPSSLGVTDLENKTVGSALRFVDFRSIVPSSPARIVASGHLFSLDSLVYVRIHFPVISLLPGNERYRARLHKVLSDCFYGKLQFSLHHTAPAATSYSTASEAMTIRSLRYRKWCSVG